VHSFLALSQQKKMSIERDHAQNAKDFYFIYVSRKQTEKDQTKIENKN